MMEISQGVERLIDLAIDEDLSAGDVTSAAIFRGDEISEGYLIAKESMVLCGCLLFAHVMKRVSSLQLGIEEETVIEFLYKDGDWLDKGTIFARFRGATLNLLKGERIALNFIQRLSGIATKTAEMVHLLGSEIVLSNTRKSQAGMRLLEHYAVRVGGGRSHRFDLCSGVMIKDNHISACGGIRQAVERVRLYASHTLKIEVEVSNEDELKEALGCGVDIVMLDNMDLETMRRCVEIIDGRAIIEVSGNVDVEKAKMLRGLGVDIVSSGAITHSVKAADISMRFS